MKLQKGLLLFNEQTRLDNGSIKPKYFVLMEEPFINTKSLILFLTTSKQKFPKREIEFKEPNGHKAYLILPKFRSLPVWKIGIFYRKIAILERDEVIKLEKSISESRFVPTNIKNRILHKSISLPNYKLPKVFVAAKNIIKPKAHRFEFVSKEKIDEIKRVLGFKI